MHYRAVLLPVALAICAAAADVTVLEQIVAKVNGDIITRGEIDKTRQAMEEELKRSNTPADKIAETLKEREKDALKDEIDRLLLVQKGKDLNVNCDPEINRRMADFQVQSKISDPDKFQQFLREQTGMPYEDFKSQLKNQCMTERVIRQEVYGRMNLGKPEIEKYFNEHKEEFVRKEQVFLREIFLGIAGKTPEQIAAVEKKAKDLVARGRKGEKFHELARDQSESDSAKNFGEIGWFKKGELRPEVESLVFTQRRNFVTDPIKTENGFLILKLEERHEAGQAPLEEVENEVTERILQPRIQPKLREFLVKLREDAFLEIRQGYVDTGAAPGKDTVWRDPAELKPETTTKAAVAASRRRRLLKIVPIPGTRVGKPEESPAAPAPVAVAAPAPPAQK